MSITKRGEHLRHARNKSWVFLYIVPIAFLALSLIGLEDIDFGMFVLTMTLCLGGYQIPFRNDAEEIVEFYESKGDTKKANLPDDLHARIIVLLAIASALFIVHLVLIEAVPSIVQSRGGVISELPVCAVIIVVFYSHLEFVFTLRTVRKAKKLAAAKSVKNDDDQRDNEQNKHDDEEVGQVPKTAESGNVSNRGEQDNGNNENKNHRDDGGRAALASACELHSSSLLVSSPFMTVPSLPELAA